MNSFYDFSVYILGDLPQYMSFLNGILAFIFAFIFFFLILSPFIFLFKYLMRW